MKSCGPVFDLNSSTVRNVLRGWIAHGDIAAVWMTQPLASSTASCLLETCLQANVVGFFAELNSNTTRQSFVHCANSGSVFSASTAGHVCFWLHRSGNVVRCSLSPLWYTCSWLDVVTILETSALFLAKRIGSWDPVLKVISSIELTESDMHLLSLVHLLTRSMPRIVGQTSNAGWVESRPGAQMGWSDVGCSPR